MGSLRDLPPTYDLSALSPHNTYLGDRVRHVVEENARVLAFVDALVEELLAEGALGARLTGGGFGGSVVALRPTG